VIDLAVERRAAAQTREEHRAVLVLAQRYASPYCASRHSRSSWDVRVAEMKLRPSDAGSPTLSAPDSGSGRQVPDQEIALLVPPRAFISSPRKSDPHRRAPDRAGSGADRARAERRAERPSSSRSAFSRQRVTNMGTPIGRHPCATIADLDISRQRHADQPRRCICVPSRARSRPVRARRSRAADLLRGRKRCRARAAHARRPRRTDPQAAGSGDPALRAPISARHAAASADASGSSRSR
jgi:hypothetical protein